MKKINSIFLSILMMLFVAVSCNSPMDENPSLTQPTSFKLNTPATASQYYELAENMSVNLTWSQPDYGFAAAATYNVQVALNEDFTTPLADGLDSYVELEEDFSSCNADVSGSSIAEAICKLRGIDDVDNYTDEPARKVYFRVRAHVLSYEGSKDEINNISRPNTNILSNVITLEKVKGYCAVKSPGYIYLVGDPEGWSGPNAGNKEHYDAWRLFESKDAIGSKIYTGIFDIPAGKAMFRFYTALTGWDDDSYGIQADDNPVDIQLADDVYSGALVKGKGSFNIPDWQGGTLKITVNMSNASKMTVKFEAGGIDLSDKEFIYLVGAPEGWAGPTAENAAHYEDWKLYDMEDNGIYTGTFDIPAEKFIFRFYKALTGWDDDSYGSQVDDSPVDIEFEEDLYSGEAVAGKGSWQIQNWTGGKVTITVDTNENIVIFQKK